MCGKKKKAGLFPVGRRRVPGGGLHVTFIETCVPGAHSGTPWTRPPRVGCHVSLPTRRWTSQRRPLRPAILGFRVAAVLGLREKCVPGFQYSGFKHMTAWRSLGLRQCLGSAPEDPTVTHSPARGAETSSPSLNHSSRHCVHVPPSVAGSDVPAPDCPPVSTLPLSVLAPTQNWGAVLHSECVVRWLAAVLCSCPTSLSGVAEPPEACPALRAGLTGLPSPSPPCSFLSQTQGLELQQPWPDHHSVSAQLWAPCLGRRVGGFQIMKIGGVRA